MCQAGRLARDLHQGLFWVPLKAQHRLSICIVGAPSFSLIKKVYEKYQERSSKNVIKMKINNASQKLMQQCTDSYKTNCLVFMYGC